MRMGRMVLFTAVIALMISVYGAVSWMNYTAPLIERLYPAGVSTDRVIYTVDDGIIVTVAVRNTGAATARVPPFSVTALTVADHAGHPVTCRASQSEAAIRRAELTIDPGATEWAEFKGKVEPGPALNFGALTCSLPTFGSYQIAYPLPQGDISRATVEVLTSARETPVPWYRVAWKLLAVFQYRAHGIPDAHYRLVRTTTVSGVTKTPHVSTESFTTAVRFGHASPIGMMPLMVSHALSDELPWTALSASQKQTLMRLRGVHERIWRRATNARDLEFAAREPVRVLWWIPLIGRRVVLGYTNRQVTYRVTFDQRTGVVLTRERIDREAGMMVSTIIATTDVAYEAGAPAPGLQVTPAPDMVRAVFEAAKSQQVRVVTCGTRQDYVGSNIPRTTVEMELLGDPERLTTFASVAAEATGRCTARPGPEFVKPWTGGEHLVKWILDCTAEPLEVRP